MKRLRILSISYLGDLPLGIGTKELPLRVSIKGELKIQREFAFMDWGIMC